MANKRDYDLDSGSGTIDDTYSIKVDKSGLIEAKEVQPSKLVQVGGAYLTAKIEIGDWNMDTTLNVTVPHGITDALTKIKSINVWIIPDLTNSFSPNMTKLEIAPDIESPDLGVSSIVGSLYLTATNVILTRVTGSLYDSAGWDSTTFNRGFVYIDYIT